jgi:hypothetical protein
MIHPRLTFKADTLGRFIQRHGLEFRYRETPGFLPGHAERHYYVELLRDGHSIGLLVTKQWNQPGEPMPEDVLRNLASDAYLYEAVGGDPVQWHDWVMVSTRPALAERWYFDKVADMIHGLMVLLGEPAYEELLELAEMGRI